MPENQKIKLTTEELKLAQGLSVWIVWYEDRFGFGSDRDPASPVAAFLTEKEANEFVMSDLGPHDISAGKFDGEFVQELNLMRAVKLGILTIPIAKELLSQSLSN